MPVCVSYPQDVAHLLPFRVHVLYGARDRRDLLLQVPHLQHSETLGGGDGEQTIKMNMMEICPSLAFNSCL